MDTTNRPTQPHSRRDQMATASYSRPSQPPLQEQAERARLWKDWATQVLADLTRSGADPLDDVDRRGYGQALRPVQESVLSGRLKANDGPLWEIRFAVRNAKFRMTYEELGAAVKKALRLPEPAAPSEARNVVRAPLALEAGPPTTAERIRDYRPAYANLPPDPRDWRSEMFSDGREFFMAVCAAARDKRIPDRANSLDESQAAGHAERAKGV